MRRVDGDDYQGIDEFRNCCIDVKLSVTQEPQYEIFVVPAMLPNR
jgi:hypothetical protein